MNRMINWLTDKFLPETSPPEPPLWQTTVRSTPEPAHRKLKNVQPVEFSADVAGRIEDRGPGKNVLIRSKYACDDTDELSIVTTPDSEQDEAYDDDPYNTGRFDLANSWKSYNSR